MGILAAVLAGRTTTSSKNANSSIVRFLGRQRPYLPHSNWNPGKVLDLGKLPIGGRLYTKSSLRLFEGRIVGRSLFRSPWEESAGSAAGEVAGTGPRNFDLEDLGGKSGLFLGR